VNDALPTIAGAAAAIANQKLSPVELTQACLDRISRHDAQLHCFITLTAERALAEARAAEAEIVRFGPRSPLHGIPIGLKDIYETKGLRTTAHSRQLEDHVPGADATTVRKLADAGTVLVGKLATHEFALGGPSFDLPWPPARNPWDPARFTGGSSSGTGAAVAAGFVLGGTGSDTGGSIRTPSAYCGITGIKPTYGRVSKHGILPLAFSLDHAGPMAWTAEDCAILLECMAGHDPHDPTTADRPVPAMRGEFARGAKGLRIGVVRHFFERDHPVSEPTRAAIDAAVAVLVQAGAHVSETVLPPLGEFYACSTLINYAEGYNVHAARIGSNFAGYGELLRDRLLLGSLISSSDYVTAMRRRRELSTALAAAMRDVDVLVYANVAGEAPEIDKVPKWASFEKPSFAMPANVTGYPAMAVCTGFGPAGLPLSMQLVGKPWNEPTLLRAAHAYEQLTPWRDRRPALATATAVTP
jgi:aspartyl-tRNA(Asn)/glutamyl-tRNA(Gln) amidotransferase subunit A